MTTLLEAADALAKAVTEGSGLRAVSLLDEDINAPIAEVALDEYDPRFVFTGEKAVYPFQVTVYVARTAVRAAQTALAGFRDLHSATSIVAAVQNSDLWPDDLVDYAAVTKVGRIVPVNVAGADYLTVTFDIDVCF